MCSLEWLGRLKCRATGLDASLSSFSTSRRCSRNRSPNRLLVSPMYSFLHNVQVMQKITFAEVHVKRFFNEWLGRLKCRATGLDPSLSSFSTSRRCSLNRSPNRLPVSPMYSFFA